MEDSNVNRLNGIPNFCMGFPKEEPKQDEGTEENIESDEGVEVGEASLGVEEGATSEEQETSVSDSPKRS